MPAAAVQRAVLAAVAVAGAGNNVRTYRAYRTYRTYKSYESYKPYKILEGEHVQLVAEADSQNN